MPDHDLDQRLQAYEAGLPDAEPPDPRVTARGHRTALATVVGLGAVAGLLLAVFLLDRPTPPVGNGSPLPSALVTGGVETLPLDTPRRHCIGDADQLRAIYRIPNGSAFWTIFPHASLAPELSEVEIPLLVVVYQGVWSGPLFGAPGAPPRASPAPGAVDVCVETVDGSDAVASSAYVVYTDIPLHALVTDGGPLAVNESNGAEARNEGTLRITEGCVFLERGGEQQLLVWPADRARWDAVGGTITFTTVRNGELTLKSGDYVELGGGGSSEAEGGMIPQERVETVTWVQRPADACLIDAWWFVSDAAVTAVPTPTPEPRPAAWVPLPFPVGSEEFASVHDVIEWDGRLVAVGRAGERRAAIWLSDDGISWQAATIPDSPPELGVSLQAPFVVGYRLMVIGITYHPAGSGPVGSVIWTSPDGLTWTDTAASAQFTGNPLHVIGIRGQTIVASEGHETPIGSAFWVSNDGGATWQRAPLDRDGWSAGGGLLHDDKFIAPGTWYEDYTPETQTAVVWTSSDGLAWERTALGAGYAARIAELRDGTLLVIGGSASQSEVTALGWTSVDGRQWVPSEINVGCCGTEFAVTPSGLVAIEGAEDGSASVIYTSSDGLNWSVHGPFAGEMRDVTWTQAFGVVVAGLDPEGRPAVIIGWENQ